MIKELLKAAGIFGCESRCPDPPAETYAIFFDEVTADGPDGLNWIYTHNGTVELYEPVRDDDTEAKFEAVLNDASIRWDKQSRYWLQSVQRYQVIYEFTFIEKRRP